MEFESERDTAKFLAKVKKSGGLTGKSFMSTSKDIAVAKEFSGKGSKGVLLAFESKSGRSIEKYSRIAKNEKEVLMPSGKRFDGIKKLKDGRTFVHLREE